MAIEYDELVNILGKVGRYEILLVAVLSAPELFNAFLNVGIVFVAGIPEHWCHVPELSKFNLTQEQIRLVSIPILQGEADFSRCQMYDRNYSSWAEAEVAAALDEDPASVRQHHVIQCHHGWFYDKSQYQSTIVSEWDLVCDRQWMRATIFSIFAAGFAVGGTFFGALSDLIGRKPSIYITATLKCASAVGLAFSPNYTTFLCMRFCVALCQCALFTSSYVLIVECVAPSWRVHATMVFGYFWSIGYMAFAGIAYAMRDWFNLQLVSSAPTILVFAFLWFIPESPRWLYTKHKSHKADKVVYKIAKFNKVQLPKNLEVKVKPISKGRAWDVFRTPRLRCRSFNLFFNWFVNSVVYYGLSLSTSDMGGNNYLNFFIAGAVEVPAFAFSQVAMACFGRRWPLAGTMALGGAALIAILAVPTGMTWMVILLGMIGKFCITASFQVVYMVTAEIYPTSIRNVAIGACSLSSRIGGIMAPYIAALGSINTVIPPLIFGAVSIAAGLLALLLPETKDKHLPETLQDGEQFEKDFQPFGSCCSTVVEGGDEAAAKMQVVTSAPAAPAGGDDAITGDAEKVMLENTNI